MIEAKKGYVKLEGDGATLLAETSTILASIKESGIPERAIIESVVIGLSRIRPDNTLDDELMENFMRELMKRVKEKRDAKKD